MTLIRRFSYTFLGLALTLAVNAQDKPATQPAKPAPDKKHAEQPAAVNEEIEVVRPYKPVLADAAKIRRSPDLNSYKVFKPNLSYSVLDKRLELNSDITQLQAEAHKQAAPLPFFNNYVKAGLGNIGTTLGELYLNNGQDEALQVGFFAKHLAQQGSLNKQNASHQQAGIFGKSILDKFTVNGELDFERIGTYYYGVNPDRPLENADPKKQRFSTFGLKGELLKNYDAASTSDYAVKADAYLLGSRFDSRESSFALSGFFNSVYKQFNIGANSSLDFTKTRDSVSFSNNIFKINPYVKFQGKNYKISVGINYVQEFGERSNPNLFPVAMAELPIVPQYATVFGGYTGDIVKGSLRQFGFENPYIGKTIIRNSREKSNIYGGIKGNAGAGFGYKAMVFYKKVDNLPLYVSSEYGFERFEIIYDQANVFGIEGEVNVRASETLTWTGKVEANKYSMKTQSYAWLKPGLRLHSNFRLSLNKKFIIDGEAVLNGERDARIFDINNMPAVVPVKSYLDLSGGAEYAIKDKLGVFVRVNNLFGNKYQRFIYYPGYGLNILGGLNYSF